MTSLRLRALLPIFLLGCAAAHEPSPIEPTPTEPTPTEPTPTPVEPVTPVEPPPPTSFETCLSEGGQLAEVAAINNNDTAAHGDLLTLAVAPDGTLAVAAADGVLKLWTFQGGFVGALTPGQFLYGVQTSAAAAWDLQIVGGRVIEGDVSGLVSRWSLDIDTTFPEVIGGTDPDIAITAVALDDARQKLAHADVREGGHVMVRALEGSEVVGPLASFTSVRDLAFLSDGALLIAGGAPSAPAIERRAAADFTLVDATFTPSGPDALEEIAVANGTVAVVGDGVVAVLDELLAPRWSNETSGSVSVALSPTGRFVFVAAADGSLRVFDAADGRPLGTIDVIDPVVVRMQPGGDVVIVGARDGAIRAFGCSL
jgi:WD40 repeat protein